MCFSFNSLSQNTISINYAEGDDAHQERVSINLSKRVFWFTSVLLKLVFWGCCQTFVLLVLFSGVNLIVLIHLDLHFITQQILKKNLWRKSKYLWKDLKPWILFYYKSFANPQNRYAKLLWNDPLRGSLDPGTYRIECPVEDALPEAIEGGNIYKGVQGRI